MTNVMAQTPAARSRARTAWGAVVATASPSSSSPSASVPAAAAVTRIAVAHRPTQVDGRRRSRRPTTTAIVPHSAAPAPDDQAASTRLARTA